MNRRDFLKLVGLGGTALLAPKPLEVIAARMADLSGPPLHVGVCRFRELHNFALQDVGILLDRWQHKDALAPGQQADLLRNWTVHLAVRRGAGRDYLRIGQRLLGRSVFGFPGREEASEPSILLRRSDSVEVWIVPQGAPRFPLPLLSACVYGPVPASDRQPRETATLPIRTVRLERARAIELGLASTSDPYEVV